ncbi:MAG: type II secretion system F family protein [Sneathiella sp.]|nr:type II secretion system F family protein [Sneathiella sp.]
MQEFFNNWISLISSEQILIGFSFFVAVAVFALGSAFYWRYALKQHAVDRRLNLALSPVARQYSNVTLGNNYASAGDEDNTSTIIRILAPLSLLASKIPIYGQSDRQKLEKNLIHAGIRMQDAVSIGIALKFLCSLVGVSSAWLFMASREMFADALVIRIVVLAVAFIAASNIPDIIIAGLANRRRRHLEDGVTDAVDLMVICAEAGLTLDTLILRVAKELRMSHQAMANELELTSAELSILPDRREALENLYNRTGVEELKTLILILAQGEKYGTPLAQSFRTIAVEGRKHKMVRLETKAAKLPAIMTLPMMLFIMPTVMVIVAGPSVYKIFELLGS